MGLGGTAFAQQFPQRPITIIVPFPPGGISGQAILAAQRISDNVGWTVIIEAVVFMIYSLNGERCTSSSRLLVQVSKARLINSRCKFDPPKRNRRERGTINFDVRWSGNEEGYDA
jgi:hypothetical protein